MPRAKGEKKRERERVAPLHLSDKVGREQLTAVTTAPHCREGTRHQSWALQHMEHSNLTPSQEQLYIHREERRAPAARSLCKDEQEKLEVKAEI